MAADRVNSHENGQAIAVLTATVVLLLANRSLVSPAAEVGKPGGDSDVANVAVHFFVAEVRPVLEARCFGYHGEQKDREAEFDMRTREGLLPTTS